MPKVSAILPSRNEKFLSKTVEDIFNKAKGDIEVIAVLDGSPDNPPIKPHENLNIIKLDSSIGMRLCINKAVESAKGDFILKCDAHCMFAEGFDEILKADCEDNWVVVPRRVSLDPEKWEIANTGKSPVDYHFLCYPWHNPEVFGLHGQVWKDRARAKLDILIDDEMSSQGSCWFMPKKHFNWLGGLSCHGYGTFVQEFQEIGNKTWLGGGRVAINKKTWYAHLHKGKTYGRGYFIDKREMVKGAQYSADFWMNNRWKERKYDIEWLIDKFWPVPTWPENWKSLPRKSS
jgi:glycosyltransferase involved in cell wall biosynthesis